MHLTSWVIPSLSPIFMCGFDMPHYEQFYVRPQDVTEESFVLRQQEFVHAIRVCRKRLGDWLTAVDGQGHRYQGQISNISSEEIVVRLQQHDFGFAEPRVSLTLVQALLKGGHFEEVVEKGTEIGVSSFQPLITERTLVDPSSHRRERWQEKAVSAMKQCGRSVCPQVLEPITLPSFIETVDGQICFIAHSEGSRYCAEWTEGQAISLLIGPEGGFTEAEVTACLSKGVRLLSLGPRRLRSETAAITAATILMSVMGEL
jgi:16S rRNA (uracil1498-N3)-methyltransferase